MNDSTVKSVKTEILSLREIKEKSIGFVIPSYQRPYIWHDDDSLKLFSDIRDAYTHDESSYFIGSVLSANPENKSNYELIDGQQRTTTLMLISLAFKSLNIKHDIAEVSVLNNHPRLEFEIRETVLNYLGGHAGLDQYAKPSAEQISIDPYLTRIDATLTVLIKEITRLKKEELKKSDGSKFEFGEFADYLFSNVLWVNNIVPTGLDLNRLFSSVNTTGVQLEPVDLLKAKLFKNIKHEKAIYNALWMACENTNDFFEKNLRTVFRSADWANLRYSDLNTFNKDIFKVETSAVQATEQGLSINEIEFLSKESDDHKATIEKTEAAADQEEIKCRSIISFDLLLIHTLRIFLAERNSDDVKPRIKADHLISIFEPMLSKDEVEIKSFLELLWQVRYQFDTWIVKWLDDADLGEAHLRLSSISGSSSAGNYYIQRTVKELNELTQLQAVRNFTGERTAQYWLTPFLSMLINNPELNEAEILRALEHIDNTLSISASTETQKSASFKLAKNEIPVMKAWSDQVTYLERDHSTSFEHYWFQKLEYLLWKMGDKSNDNKLKKYRITSKNSVEHVFPQNHEHGEKIEEKQLNSFGNLVLLSPGENSSYSNQTVGKKMADFKDKPHYDSLKLSKIFDIYKQTNQWEVDEIKKHQKEMISILSNHYHADDYL